jgi:molybdopterin synthase catalytic subunit
MSVHVSIHDGPLPPSTPSIIPGAGAVLQFEGVVRAEEGARTILALSYEAYEPMASRALTSLAAELLARHALLAIDVQHSRGQVHVGGCSFRLTIHSRHRKEALATMDEFIDRMKRDVPIWKTPVWA